MKFEYTGEAKHNYYGFFLTDGCIIDVPSSLINKFRSNDSFTEKRASKKKKEKEDDKG